MSARLSAFVIWALVSASAAFWGLRLLVRAPVPPPHVVATADPIGASGDLTRLLGAPPRAAAVVAAAPEASSRFKLLGIVAPRDSRTREGVALIAIDGKPARAFSVGSTIDGELVLQSVSLRTAALGPAEGRQTVVLEVPRLPAAATGTLPPPGSPAMGPGPAAPPLPVTPLPTPPAAQPAAVPVLPALTGAAPSVAPAALVPGAVPSPPPPVGVPPGTVAREGAQTQ